MIIKQIFILKMKIETNSTCVIVDNIAIIRIILSLSSGKSDDNKANVHSRHENWDKQCLYNCRCVVGRCRWVRSCCSLLTRSLSRATSSRQRTTGTSGVQWRKCPTLGLYWTSNCAVSSALWLSTFRHRPPTASGKRFHSMLEKSLKMLEFGIKTSRPLKVLENR